MQRAAGIMRLRNDLERCCCDSHCAGIVAAGAPLLLLPLRRYICMAGRTWVLVQHSQRWEPMAVPVLVEEWHLIDEGHLQV
jgi:hypothetical protein